LPRWRGILGAMTFAPCAEALYVPGNRTPCSLRRWWLSIVKASWKPRSTRFVRRKATHFKGFAGMPCRRSRTRLLV